MISVVQQDLEKFDAVCMATALHTLASMRASGQQYAALFERPELLQLMNVIGECPLAPSKVQYSSECLQMQHSMSASSLLKVQIF